MGYVHAEIRLKNPRLPKLKPVNVRTMVDAGALMLCIPEHIAVQLKLETNSQREVTTADGRRQMVPYVGPIEVVFENRSCFVGALVSGDEVLLGSVPMKDGTRRPGAGPSQRVLELRRTSSFHRR